MAELITTPNPLLVQLLRRPRKVQPTDLPHHPVAALECLHGFDFGLVLYGVVARFMVVDRLFEGLVVDGLSMAAP